MGYENIEPVALRFAAQKNLLAIDLGSAHNKPDGYIGIDMRKEDGVDVVCDVSDGLPFEDSSVGVIRAVDFIEHISDGVALFNEFYRVLAPGAFLLTHTPSSDGRGAFQDPTHVSFYNENSFWYYTDRNYQRFVPEIQANFLVVNLFTHFPTEWHRDHNIPYVVADLMANKEN